MIKMEVKRGDASKSFCIYFESVEDVKKYEMFIRDLIDGVRKKCP